MIKDALCSDDSRVEIDNIKIKFEYDYSRRNLFLIAVDDVAKFKVKD